MTEQPAAAAFAAHAEEYAAALGTMDAMADADRDTIVA